MKKLLALALIAVSVTAMADGDRHGGHHEQRHESGHWQHQGGGPDNWVWVVPAIIGGAIVYEATRQPAPQPVVQQSNCSPWTEIQNPDGTITRTRTCRK